MSLTEKFFIPLPVSATITALPKNFSLSQTPHPLALQAAQDLQHYLKTQNDWEHNFGLSSTHSGSVIGKMFGVLVVKNERDEMGYLAAVSGKLAGSNQHLKFVPPVFDGLSDQSFVTKGMKVLTAINLEIKLLEETKSADFEEKIKVLKSTRKLHSNSLQRQIFDNYFFLNQAGEKKSLDTIFTKAGYKNPPAGAGECAGPKLLQYAFQHQLKPIALTEFWWGLSPKSNQWKHGHFYTCCKEKCEPILDHMLNGLEV